MAATMASDEAQGEADTSRLDRQCPRLARFARGGGMTIAGCASGGDMAAMPPPKVGTASTEQFGIGFVQSLLHELAALQERLATAEARIEAEAQKAQTRHVELHVSVAQLQAEVASTASAELEQFAFQRTTYTDVLYLRTQPQRARRRTLAAQLRLRF